MKKILFSAIAFIAAATALHAQEETNTTTGFAKGDVFITGSVGFDSQKTGDNKTSQYTIVPKAGYFVTNNIALGVSLGYGHTKQDSTADFGSSVQKTNTFTAGVFGRYYTTPAATFSFFGQLGAFYHTTKSKSSGVEGQPTNTYDVSFTPGISYFVSPHFALEATIGSIAYSSTKTDYPGAQSTNSFGIGVDLTNIAFGAVYKF